jgi:hypothetical protein
MSEISIDSTKSHDKPVDDLNKLKIELRSKIHNINSSVFLLENKLNTDESLRIKQYVEQIHIELDQIISRLTH